MLKVKVKITSDIFKKTMFCGHGVRPIITNCAVSEGIRELFPNAKVTGTFIAITDNRGCDFIRIEIDLPQEARHGIQLFDRTAPALRPYLPEFSFEIEIPDSVIELISIGQVYKVLSESSTMELVMN